MAADGHSKSRRWLGRGMFIQEAKTRRIWGVTIGLAAGILLGGGVKSIENRACTQAEPLPNYCVTEDAQMRIVGGMVSGAFASGGAILFIGLWGQLQHLNEE